MPPARFGSVALVVGFAAGLLTASPGLAELKMPPDFAFELGKDSPGKVTFSHASHVEKTGRCTACHTKVFKMKRGSTGPLIMAAMEAGHQCGTCHNGKAEMRGKIVFSVDDKANCEKCHRK